MDTAQINTRALEALTQLTMQLGLSVDDTGGSISISGSDPIFPSAVRLGEALAVASMAQAVGIAAIWREKTYGQAIKENTVFNQSGLIEYFRNF